MEFPDFSEFSKPAPQEGNSDNRVAARQLHDLYVALQQEGFSQLDALKIIMVTVQSMIEAGYKRDTEDNQ